MGSYYDELFKICGFEPWEIDKERPRIEKAFQKLELGSKDMKTAENWVQQSHDIELMGVRKILGIWLRELIDLILAKEEGKKLIYFGFPTITGPAAAIAAASAKLFCTCPDVVFCYTIGQIFDKLTPILEAGEEGGLPPGHALCSLQQIRNGGLAKGMIPVPDMVLTSSYYCDMGSKADELLRERYGYPAVYVDGSMDSKWGEFPDYLPERVEFLGGQLEKIFDKVKEVLGVEITTEARSEGGFRGRQLFSALSELVELMKNADPQPISIVEVDLARRLTNGSISHRIMTEGPSAIALLNQEVRERINKGIGVVEKGAPRTIVLVEHFSDPSIMHMIENAGLCVLADLFSLMSAKVSRTTPFISGEILAKQEMARGVFHSTYGLIKWVLESVQNSNLDGVIWNYLFNCRPLSQTSQLAKQYIEEQTGIPVLSLEFDLADSRVYSGETLKTRVETFADMLRAKKTSATA
ncbi:MAG: 2-hydroxyacyl-CoA dehydratase [Desulfobacteraceae bacterium]|nr:2-hydroxyacyl-CoA dehydratase [Desulfobacteraceae bacterium]